MLYEDLSVFNRSFWDLWFQKLLRNIASVKYQWLAFLYVPVVWGMFHTKPGSDTPWISAALGLGFLGGGFITLATTRMIVRTRLTEDEPDTYGQYKEANKNIEKQKKIDNKQLKAAHKKALKASERADIAEVKARKAMQNLANQQTSLDTGGINKNVLDTDE